MKYRQFKTINKEVSALGLGTMRLPVIQDGDKKVINEPEAIGMIRYSIDHGVNYIDTAYPYHDGFSEVVTGKALLNGYRERVILTTKLPCWMIQTPDDFDKYLDEQLEKLQTSHVDFYLLHALFSQRWEQMKSLNVFKWLDKVLNNGKIRNVGFSYHGDAQLFPQIIDSYDWKMCQIQYNYVNEYVQAGTRGLEYAASKGIPVVIMEPLLGGFLANPPLGMMKVFEGAQINPVEAALKWLLNKSEVSCVLSGMSTLDQVKQNIAIAGSFEPGCMSDSELELISKVKKLYLSYHKVPCTKCGYCQPCPSGVNIPLMFEIYNEALVEDRMNIVKGMYNWHVQDSEKANNCIGCSECESHCPQQIAISELMKEIHGKLVF
jgi:predicted aldo/keto reductase-like oxidoreductase